MLHFLLILHILTNSLCFQKPNNLHPIHVSIAEVNINEKAKKVEIAVKIFSDDLDKVLFKRFKKVTHFYDNMRNFSTDSIAYKYLNDNIFIKYNNKKLNFKGIGIDFEQEATWIFLESNSIGKPKVIALYFGVLHELWDDQLNMVNCTYQNYKKSFTFNSSNSATQYWLIR